MEYFVMRYAEAMGNALVDIMYMASDHAMMEATAGWSCWDWHESCCDFDDDFESPSIAKALGDIQHAAATFFSGE
jgi:hypothetical protein